MNTFTMKTPLVTSGGSTRLLHWGVIRAQGVDAVKFLQGQLTNDVSSLSASSVRLAGFCSAKGRLQANFLVWKGADDELLLACASSVLPATLKRLSMFVMRAQCKLSDASSELQLHGLVVNNAQTLMGGMQAAAEAPVWSQSSTPQGTLLRLPDAAGLARCMLVTTAHQNSADTLPLNTWRWLEVQSGIPIIEAATADAFVPQMLNYEVLGGVDFKKGCYPGQEIVARSQYRGTIKRRMFLFDCAAPAHAGQEIFHSADSTQPAGMVVNAALQPSDLAASDAHESTRCSALVEVKLAALEGGSLYLSDLALSDVALSADGSADGAAVRSQPNYRTQLHLSTLPYAVPTETAN
jgi:tRNA-modifying protein YgfZ